MKNGKEKKEENYIKKGEDINKGGGGKWPQNAQYISLIEQGQHYKVRIDIIIIHNEEPVLSLTLLFSGGLILVQCVAVLWLVCPVLSWHSRSLLRDFEFRVCGIPCTLPPLLPRPFFYHVYFLKYDNQSICHFVRRAYINNLFMEINITIK